MSIIFFISNFYLHNGLPILIQYSNYLNSEYNEAGETMDFNSSKTFENLHLALDSELKDSTMYRIYGTKAREDGFEQIGNIFDNVSKNEMEHARIWFKLLNNGEIPYTLNNLKDAYEVETYEWTDMYQSYADVARSEGYNDIAYLFEEVANIERRHDYNFRMLALNIENGKVFCKQDENLWICINCGNIIRGRCAPPRLSSLRLSTSFL